MTFNKSEKELNKSPLKIGQLHGEGEKANKISVKGLSLVSVTYVSGERGIWELLNRKIFIFT